jgi:Family of unknown function (DUF6401)
MSRAALRLARHVGQTALERAAASGVSVVAQLDQHIAAVRAEIVACQRAPVAPASKAIAPAGQEGGSPACPCCRAHSGRRGRSRLGARRPRSRRGSAMNLDQAEHPGQISHSGEATARADAPYGAEGTCCPDVPFAASALHAEAILPLELLLHYTSGFVQAALGDGWIPEASADASDWVSVRLAAICQLIRQAEAAAALHPDLRAIA